MSSFSNEKQLRFTITLGAGTFGTQSGANTVIIDKQRSIVEIDKAGGQMMSDGRFRIYGVPLDIMNKLTTLAFHPLQRVLNSIKVEAIDGTQATTVFTGQIYNSWPDFQSAPDVNLCIVANGAYYGQINPVPPKSYKGQTPVSVIAQAIAKDLNVAFENNGVKTTLSNPYFDGSAVDQLRELAQAAKIDFYLDVGILAICPQGIARTLPATTTAPLISKDSGLVGYPTFDSIGVAFVTIFNPAIVFGGQIQLQSDIVQANGVWQATSINLRLESQKPGGQWFSQVRCTGTGLVPIP